MSIWKNKKLLSSRYVLGRYMDICKSRMEDEHRKSGMRDGLQKCLVQFFFQISLLKPEKGRSRGSGLKVVWFGVIDFWQKLDLLEQKQTLPKPRWAWLALSIQVWVCCWFWMSVCMESRAYGNKTNLECLYFHSCKYLAVFFLSGPGILYKNNSEVLPWASTGSNLDKQKGAGNKGIKSAKPLLTLLQASSAVCYNLFQALVHTEPSTGAYLAPLWWCWNALGHCKSLNITCQNGEYLSLSLIVKDKWNAGPWMVELIPAFAVLTSIPKRK